MTPQCDLGQPICGNCKSGKFVCGGYQRDIIVVQADTAGKGQYKRQLLEKRRQAPLRAPSLTDVRSKDLNRSAFEIHCFNAFWSLYLPRVVLSECPTKPSIAFNAAGNWARWARWTQDMVPNCEHMRCALLAVSASRVGQSRHDPTMIHHGMKLYGKAISQVAGQLKDLPRLRQTEVIATCRLLALYEVPISLQNITCEKLTEFVSN